MEITKKYLDNGQYLTDETEKKSIFLHHTVSLNAMGAWRWWNATPERVGTPYLIERDGTIIETFDPKYNAFHLGVPGDHNVMNNHSIGIEIVAAGFLHKEDDKFLFYPLWPNKFRPEVIPNEDVCELKKEFGGFKYFHKYTEAQITSLIWLIKKLKEEFPTLVIDNDLTDFWVYNPKVIKEHTPGIWGHSTVLAEKTDVFPYEPLLKALKEMQDSYKPASKVIPKQTK